MPDSEIEFSNRLKEILFDWELVILVVDLMDEFTLGTKNCQECLESMQNFLLPTPKDSPMVMEEAFRATLYDDTL